MRREENLIDPIMLQFRHIWRHRPKLELFGRTIIADQTIPGAILDVIDELGLENRSKLKPVLVKSAVTDYGGRVVLHLPPGISVKDIEAKLTYFEEQVAGRIEISISGPTLTMDVYTAVIPQRVSYAWQPEQYSDYALPVPIGYDYRGLMAVDLYRLPHLFVAGNTGSGKTSWLLGLVTSLLQTGQLRGNVAVIVIDLKMVDFADYSEHAIICDTEQLAGEALEFLNQELDRRLWKLKAARVKKVSDYSGEMPYIVLVVDELAELKDQDSQQALNRLTRLARAPGICVVGATQRPSHTVYKHFTDTRAMFQGRLCFSVASRQDSEIALGNDAADKLPKDIPGRAVFQWERQTIVQSMYLTDAQSVRIFKSLGTGRKVMDIEQSQNRLLPR